MATEKVSPFTPHTQSTRVALYARVSTSGSKRGKKQDPEMQLRELREYCDRRKWTTEIFTDAGHSGAKINRPELDRMMAACRRGKFDVVVVYRFDLKSCLPLWGTLIIANRSPRATYRLNLK